MRKTSRGLWHVTDWLSAVDDERGRCRRLPVWRSEGDRVYPVVVKHFHGNYLTAVHSLLAHCSSNYHCWRYSVIVTCVCGCVARMDADRRRCRRHQTSNDGHVEWQRWRHPQQFPARTDVQWRHCRHSMLSSDGQWQWQRTVTLGSWTSHQQLPQTGEIGDLSTSHLSLSTFAIGHAWVRISRSALG